MKREITTKNGKILSGHFQGATKQQEGRGGYRI